MPNTRLVNIIPTARTGRPSKTFSIVAGTPIGLLLALTYSNTTSVFRDLGLAVRIFNTFPRTKIKFN